MSNYCYNCMNEVPDGQSVCPYCHKDNTPDNIVYRLKPGTILDDKYLVGNCLGEGGFGITYIGRDLSLDIKVAIKEYYPNGYVNRNNSVDQNVNATTESQKHIFYKGKDSFMDEARKIAKFLGEPGIVGVREYFEANGTAYIIMEYLDGENLASYIKQNGTFEARKIFKLMLPITYSLKHIHSAGMIHRDISPDNIMYMRNGSLKLMDFGSARYFTNEQKEMSVLLKQGYAPEEQYRKNGKQGPWTDVYGLCATMYRCITGNIPEDALDRLRGDNLVPPSKMGVSISPALENILLYGLAVFKENRCQNMEELSSLIELALDNPQAATQKTANLLRKNQASQQSEQHTYLADDEVSLSQRSGGNKPGYATPIQPSGGSYATPVSTPQKNSSSYATPVSSPQKGSSSYATPVSTPQKNSSSYATPVSSPQKNSSSYATPVSSPQKSNSSYATPISTPQKNNASYATPVSSPQKNSSSYATPVSTPQKNNSSYATPQSGYSQQIQNAGYSGQINQSSYSSNPSVPAGSGSYGVSTAVAPAPKKKKTGLIIGLIIGGIVTLSLIVTLVFVLGFSDESTLDGTYRMTEMVSNGEDQSSDLQYVNVNLVITNNIGTIDLGDTHMVWKFDTQNKTITNEDNQTIPYRQEGKKLIIEDTSSSDRMVFEKQ